MAVLATPDWLYNTRDNTMDIPTRQQRTSPAIEANGQQQQQQPGQLQYQQQQQHFQQQQQLLQQQQQMLLAAQQQQSFTYPIQQQPHGSWTPNITAAPFYPSFFQQQQQQPQPYPGPQGTYFDPANAQFAAQWAYQQMMFNAQHTFPQSQRQNQPPSPNIFNPFPSGTPPPPPHRQMSADQYPGFHPYRRPNRQQSSSADGSSDRRQGPPHPPYARPDASASSSSISSSGSRQRTNSNQSIKSSNNNHSSTSRRGSPVSATAGGQNSTRGSPSTGGSSSSPNLSQPANPSPLRQPHHRSPSTSSTSTATSIRPGAPLSPSLPTSSVSTTSATATTTTTITSGNSSSTNSPTPRLNRPSPLSQGTFTASEKRISRDDIDLGALQDAAQRESSRSGGLKGRLRRALSFNTAQVLKEEEAVEQDDDVSIKASQINNKAKGKATAASTATASGSSSNANSDKPSSPSTNPPDSAVDDGSSTRAAQPKKKSRAASLFNSRMNMSTDNISLSSTVSSASVMIRKLGAMGKLARRNSLAGIASLFKDKDKDKEGDNKKKKKDRKHSAKAEASEASVSHVTAELDRMGGDWTVNSAELQGLTPAAKLARQHTLKSNAEAAARAKEAAAAARDAEATAASLVSGANKMNGNGVAGVAAWDKNTATRQGSPIKSPAGNVRINEDGTRTLIEDDDEDSDEEGHYGYQASPSSSSSYGGHPHSDGWDDDDDWELEGDEDVTIRGADVSSGGSRSGGSFDEDGFDHPHGAVYGRPSMEMEPWAVDVRRSVERNKKPAKGILRNAQSYDQTRYLQHHAAITSRGRSNSYTSTNTNTEIGPLARMPTPDPDHIDGLRHNPRSSPLTDVAPFSLPPLSFESSSTLNVSFSPSKDLLSAPPIATSHSDSQGQNRTSAIFQNPIFNSSAPALSLGLLSASTKSPPTLTHRSQTAPTKRLTFASNLSVYDTFPPAVYDRRSEPATWNRLTPALAQRIKEELNSYKMEEMEVHAASRIHTQFFV